MALRVTQQFAEFATGDAESSDLRVEAQFVAVLAASAFDPDLRLTTQWLEVCIHNVYRGFTGQLGTIRSSLAGSTLVLGYPVLGQDLSPLIVSAADTLVVATDAATFTIARGVAATDTLSFTEIVRKIYEVSAIDSITLSDQALVDYVRVSPDTLVLTEDAVADVEMTRTAVDTLTLVETAVGVGVWPRSAGDTLTLSDSASFIPAFEREVYEALSLIDAAVGDRISLVSDTLVLSEQATVDLVYLISDTLILSGGATRTAIYGRVASDSVTLAETALGAHVVPCGASDTLSLGETSVGDYCKVSSDTVAFTETASYDFVRLIADTLTLQEDASLLGVYVREAYDVPGVVFTEEANLEREVDVNATDAISLTEDAASIFEVTDTLSLAETASADYSQVAYDTLVLSEVSSVIRDRRSSADSLVLTGVASVNVIRNVAARDHLSVLDEHAWPGFHRVTASDELQTSYIEYDPYTYETTIVYEGLQDVAQASLIYAVPKEVEDHLSFAEQAVGIKILAGAIAVSASDSFALTEDVRRCSIGGATDSFVLTDAASTTISKLLADELDLSDAASCNVVRNSLTASDTLELGEAVLWFNRLEDFLCVYHPFVGEGSGDLPDPPSEELEGPIPGITDTFKLVYPATQPFDDTLVLRAPNLGNRDRLMMNRISRETRGGTRIVYADSMWPKIQTHVLDFSGLTQTEASGLHTFIDAHLGMEIGMLDWEHRFWRGIITELASPIVQDGPGCKYTVGFEFEGELTDSYYLISESLSLSDAAIGVL